MDKYEYKVRAEEIKQLIAQEEYAQAAEIADTIDWRRVKSVMMLCTISDLYKINRRYEDARDMLLLAYERRPGGRTICYSLCELSIKMEEYVQAVEYYKEFVQVAPKDSGRYILQYKLYEAQDVSLEERIEVLEELKKRDYREKWAYELAYLYHRVGLATRCVEECDEMILWFGDGKYVIKAMELKKLHQPLSPAQQEKYENRFCAAEEVVSVQAEEPAIPEEVTEATDPMLADTKVYGAVMPEIQQQTDGQESDDMDIHVKTMDVGEYNTINLQAELAEGLKEVLGEENIQNPITRTIMAPMLESDTETLDYPLIDEVSEDDLELVTEKIESSEVFFGETGEILQIHQNDCVIAEELLADTGEEKGKPEEVLQEAEEDTAADVTAEIVMEQMRQEKTGEIKEKVLHAEPPKELAGVLAQESDGQITLVMPEKENVEKQITGQMSIEDILAEWERMKKENEEKRKEEVRQHVLQQTGSMFTEFEAAVRDGLLEQLERGKITGDELIEAAENYTEDAVSVVENVIVEEDETEDIVWDVAEVVSDENEEAEELLVTQDVPAAEEVFVEEEETSVEEEVPVEEETSVEEEVPVEEEASVEEEVPVEEEASVEEEVPVEEEASVEEEVPVGEEFSLEEDVPAAEEVSKEEDILITEEVHEESEPEVIKEAAEAETHETKEETAKPAVEREKAKVRVLTREERELYAPYIQSRSAREHLVKAIDNISLAAYTGNIIITGEEGMDIMTLAKNMIREVQMEDSNFSGKVAKISGKALNKKEVAAIVRDLKNGALIIQKASEMSGQTTDALNKALQQEHTGIIVVMVDTQKAMNQFLEQNRELQSCFTARMDVEPLSNDTLVAFGRQYAREKEYSIDEMGVLAMHTRIENMQTIDHVVTVVEVKEMVDEAIRHANRKTVGHFFDILLAKRYDEEDMIILGEKDFA
uniref:tetratricopeptide repeat protein n=1 Tax=Acetatifactor sp. TaxID=1872090 RepID=UPI004056C946